MGGEQQGEGPCGCWEGGGALLSALSCTTATLQAAVSSKSSGILFISTMTMLKNIEIPAMSRNSTSLKRGRTVESSSER